MKKKKALCCLLLAGMLLFSGLQPVSAESTESTETMQTAEAADSTEQEETPADTQTPGGETETPSGETDTTAPVFSGWIGKKSAYNGCVLRVCYDDRKDTYDFLDHIKAVDDRDGTVEIAVDASAIDWETEGIYKVWYTASDKAGNVATTWAKVQVLKAGTAESIADDILSSITKSSWSDEKKLRAIYKYVKNNITYVHRGSHKNWRKVAVNGIRYQSGDCFTYYSVSRLLITRLGIPNIMICRYPIPNGMEHYWNLVYVRGGWYHFDTCPRSRDGYFCLQTDAQLRKYSTGYVFKFNKKLYPARATKKISRDPV
jgi:hypothetical protein